MATTQKYDGFTDDERSAMKQRASELKAGSKGTADVEADVLAKIAEMAEGDRATAAWLHAAIKDSVPNLIPRLWYGMPAYTRDGTIVCHFQPAAKFKSRYPTLGFSDAAHLDDGAVWPVAFALHALTPDAEAHVVALLRRAVG